MHLGLWLVQIDLTERWLLPWEKAAPAVTKSHLETKLLELQSRELAQDQYLFFGTAVDRRLPACFIWTSL